MRPLSSLDWTFGHDRVDLPEVVLSLSLVFEFERRAFRDGHDQAEGWESRRLVILRVWVFLFW